MAKEKLTKKHIGVCGVDAGMLMIVDPCYVVDRPIGKMDWGEFLKLSGMQLPNGVWPEHGYVRDPVRSTALGVVVHTRYGDGEYPVIGYFDSEGRIAKIEIKF